MTVEEIYDDQNRKMLMIVLLLCLFVGGGGGLFARSLHAPFRSIREKCGGDRRRRTQGSDLVVVEGSFSK